MTPVRSLLMAAALAALALPAPPGRALEPPMRPPMSALSKIRDLAATVRARRALEEDRVLHPLNLGVTVENGVASVWGPVPSLDIGRQAVARLETVKGVSEVRLDLYLAQPPADLRREQLVGPVAPPERIATAKPAIETGHLPTPVRSPAPAPAPAPAPVAVSREQPAGDGPRLFAPRVAAAVRPRPEASATVVKMPGPAPSLAERVREAQQSEPRFRRIAVRLEGTSVLVRRTNSSGRDVMDLVGRLRHIAGVSDVILTDD